MVNLWQTFITADKVNNTVIQCNLGSKDLVSDSFPCLSHSSLALPPPIPSPPPTLPRGCDDAMTAAQESLKLYSEVSAATLEVTLVRHKVQQAWRDLLAKEHLRDLRGATTFPLPCLPALPIGQSCLTLAVKSKIRRSVCFGWLHEYSPLPSGISCTRAGWPAVC